MWFSYHLSFPDEETEGPPLQAGCFSQRPPSPLGAPPSAAERRFGARALVTFAFPRRCHSTLALKRFWMSPCFLYQEVNRHTDPGWPHDNTDPTKHPWNYVLMWFSPLSSASWYHLLLILNPLFSRFPLPRTCLEHDLSPILCLPNPYPSSRSWIKHPHLRETMLE